ncbi:ABC transporter permease [Litchfieldia alkalitelluris]|uniref:ABC transporter permease n=1 Tax=Litchfieldia alkalitelluris TaxID=304268 RepID=UPI0009971DD6|nr:ABC transporter permease [Litchfieldia alkalitelluris]
MVDINELWKKRYNQFTTEIRRYLKYMFNDHLLIALIFFTGGAAFYYNRWLEDLPDHIPYVFIISVVLAMFLTNGTVQTLLKEPDLVFLLPIEKKLDTYFQKAYTLSSVFQSYVLLILFAIIAPLYLKLSEEHTLTHLGVIFVIVLLSKMWNLLMTWNIHFLYGSISKYSDILIRLFLNFVLCYFLFESVSVYLLFAVIAIKIGLLAYFYKARSKRGLKWDLLIDLESKRMMTFYRLANLFTDVPKLQERIKRRRWLNWITTFSKYSQKNTFGYLYLRTFLRTSDYLGIYIRLTIIGGLALYFLQMEYGNLAIGLLFLYLTGYQLMTLWRHHHLKIWLDLYPLPLSIRTASFLKLMTSILMIQTFIFSIFILVSGQWLFALLLIVVGVVFIYFFVNHYIKTRLLKML